MDVKLNAAIEKLLDKLEVCTAAEAMHLSQAILNLKQALHTEKETQALNRSI